MAMERLRVVPSISKKSAHSHHICAAVYHQLYLFHPLTAWIGTRFCVEFLVHHGLIVWSARFRTQQRSQSGNTIYECQKCRRSYLTRTVLYLSPIRIDG